MFGYVYTFENEGARTGRAQQPVSVAASMAIEAGINDRAGMHYQELTDSGNPRPMFAVLFTEAEQQNLFEILFQPALRLCGLRIAAMRALAESEIRETPKPDLGYIDREGGYAFFIPSLRSPVEDG